MYTKLLVFLSNCENSLCLINNSSDPSEYVFTELSALKLLNHRNSVGARQFHDSLF